MNISLFSATVWKNSRDCFWVKLLSNFDGSVYILLFPNTFPSNYPTSGEILRPLPLKPGSKPPDLFPIATRIWGTTMQDDHTQKAASTFPHIETDMIDRLSKEAEDRTLQPQDVDWADIHRQAARARGEG